LLVGRNELVLALFKHPTDFALVVALFLGYSFIIVQAEDARENYCLTKDGQQGVAVVTKVLGTGHNAVASGYRVNQSGYTVEDARSWQNPK